MLGLEDLGDGILGMDLGDGFVGHSSVMYASVEHLSVGYPSVVYPSVEHLAHLSVGHPSVGYHSVVYTSGELYPGSCMGSLSSNYPVAMALHPAPRIQFLAPSTLHPAHIIQESGVPSLGPCILDIACLCI